MARILTALLLLAAACLARGDFPGAVPKEKWLAARRKEHTTALLKFLTFPTVSADSSHTDDILAACKWLVNFLSADKLVQARVLETDGGAPAVYASREAAKGLPTLLLYGHLDVQPAGDPSLWTAPPFQPTIRDGKVYARGASDDKGLVLAAAIALRAYAANTPSGEGIGIKLLVETEEEIGSPRLASILEEHANLLKADYAFSVDGNQVGREQPGLCLGLRGAAAVSLGIDAASADAHSGIFGGGVPNPLHALAELVAKLHNPDGSIAIPGYLDDVRPLGPDDRVMAHNFPVPASEGLALIGAQAEFGEPGYNFWERTWFRPTVEVVGMGGGFQGEGMKTVLPGKASAKISLRLVPGQIPARSANRVKEFLETQGALMTGVRVVASLFPFAGDPYEMAWNAAGNQAAADVLKSIYGKEPVGFRLGGSIPFMALARRMLGVDTTMLGISYSDENLHGPDENWELESAERAEIAYVRLFDWFDSQDTPKSAAANGTGEKQEL